MKKNKTKYENDENDGYYQTTYSQHYQNNQNTLEENYF